jgi:hypothetical protein
VDSNGQVEPADTIFALKAASGSNTPVLDSTADVNGDRRVGMAEAIYALREAANGEYQSVPLYSTVTAVQPMTGIVFWQDSEHRESNAIQLEYAYVGYDQLVTGAGAYNWSPLDTMLDQIAARNHQAVIRFYFVYPGRATTVPAYIKQRSDYNETQGFSEGKATWFPDWSNNTLQTFMIDFFSAAGARYDHDPRLAFLQVGFGLWAEYHIYDGPMVLGGTFPDRGFQALFIDHMSGCFSDLKWSISIDAAETERSPFGQFPALLDLDFGLFDDSFLCEDHPGYNHDCFTFFNFSDRFSSAPMGGELSYYSAHDQETALSPGGPHGVPFEQLAGQYHITYMIGSDQPDYQPLSRIKEAGMALGYRFRITSFETSPSTSRGTIINRGIAPIYYDAYVTVNSVRSAQTLKGLLPGQTLSFTVPAGGGSPDVAIACDRLVPGQQIQFEADLEP